MDLGIRGRKAIVCGGSKGLGLACADALAMEGVDVMLVARGEDRLWHEVRNLKDRHGGEHRYFVADLEKPESVSGIVEAMPQPDILINNTGGPPEMEYMRMESADWTQAMRSTFYSAVELIKEVSAPMVRNGFGRIVNITSVTVRCPLYGLELSSAPRLALTGYVASVARQVVSHNVTINNLLPGPFLTDRVRDLGQRATHLIERIPAGRMGQPDELGAACAYLCSQQAGFITAQNILVDGGFVQATI